MYIYYFEPLEDAYIIKDYNAGVDGLRFYHNTAFIHHNAVVINKNQVVNDISEALKQIQTKKPIIYNGENINPIKCDIFLSYNPYTMEVYETYNNN